MTTEEKYKEIQEARKVANDAKGNPSGVKVDPPTETNPAKPTEEGEGTQQPKPAEEGGAKNTEPPKPKHTLEEQQQFAIAKMRAEFKKEMDALRKENEELKAKFAGNNQPAKKTRKDFETDEAYESYVRDSISESVKGDLKKENEEKEKAEAEKQAFTKKVYEGLEGISKGLAEKVFTDLADENSRLHAIITDERARELVKEIKGEFGADLLALAQAKPEIFEGILALPAEKQKYRLWMLEDQITSVKSKVSAKQQADKEKQERADSLPTAGAFGRNGTGTSDISGLSTEERVNRYKAEMLKKRR